jgi:hypothetical protein
LVISPIREVTVMVSTVMVSTPNSIVGELRSIE